jgi:hypothetical protein
MSRLVNLNRVSAKKYRRIRGINDNNKQQKMVNDKKFVKNKVIYQRHNYLGFFTLKGWNFHNRRSSEARPTVNISPQRRLKDETERSE